MSRAVWIVLLLLLATNAAWVVAWIGGDEPDSTDVADTAVLEETITELQEELSALRRAEPILIGSNEASGHSTAAEADGGTHPTGERPTPTEEDPAEQAEREAEAAKVAEADAARQKAYEEARAAITAMYSKVMQVADPALREEGLREIAAALRGTDPYLTEYALSALYSLRNVEFERGEFASLARGLLQSENGGIRRSALYALAAMDPEGSDPRVAIDSASDPDPIVRMHTAKLLTLYGGSRIEGDAADAVLLLLEDDDTRVQRGTLRGLAGAQVAPAIESRLIELTTDPSRRQEAVQFGLGPLKEKSREVIDALFTHLGDENGRVRQHAHKGLQQGVPKGEQLYVAKRYADQLGTFVNPKTHREALKLITQYGDASLRPQLEAFAENELVDAKVRALARKAADYLVNKKPDR